MTLIKLFKVLCLPHHHRHHHLPMQLPTPPKIFLQLGHLNQR
jgi:hypothetical protein